MSLMTVVDNGSACHELDFLGPETVTKTVGTYEVPGSGLAPPAPLAGFPGSYKVICQDGKAHGRGLDLACHDCAAGRSSH